MDAVAYVELFVEGAVRVEKGVGDVVVLDVFGEGVVCKDSVDLVAGAAVFCLGLVTCGDWTKENDVGFGKFFAEGLGDFMNAWGYVIGVMIATEEIVDAYHDDDVSGVETVEVAMLNAEEEVLGTVA